MSVYVLDSNFFIEAHRATYPFDVMPGFWNKVSQLANEEKIISIDKVKKEIYRNEDQLKNWCAANLPKNFFKDTSEVMTAYGKVAEWANTRSNHYSPQALSEFLDLNEADAFLVAYALADPKNRIVVTREISEPKRKVKIKIPDACVGLNIQFINLIEMFRALGETF